MSATARQYDLIRRQFVTEKSTAQQAQLTYMFEVAMDATKPEVRAAVEAVFNVKVVGVNTGIRKGKTTRFRGRPGRRADRKVAYVTLVEGHSIQFSSAGK